MRLPFMIVLLAVSPACGSRRVAGYLEDLEGCSATSSGTGETGTTQGTESSGDTSAAESSAGSTVASSEATGTSSGTTGSSGSSGSGETADSSTGEPMAECGNGVLEVFGPVPEECDDNNLDPDDGCSDTCALDRRVFVTSAFYQGAELQSLYIADALCSNRADDQGWPEPLKYRAWLSDSTTDARDRLTRGRGRLVMVNGLVFATSWSALLAGKVENPLEVTEKSETYHGGVWTGTRPDGTAVPGAEHCDDWSSDSVQKTGHYGYSDRATPEWTLSALDDNPISCTAEFALYCIQSL